MEEDTYEVSVLDINGEIIYIKQEIIKDVQIVYKNPETGEVTEIRSLLNPKSKNIQIEVYYED